LERAGMLVVMPVALQVLKSSSSDGL